MQYILLHFALYPEAKSIIEYLNAKLIKRLKNIQIFKADNTFILITGSGYINTSNGIAWTHLENKELINNALCINMGIAASYSIPLYTWNYIGEIIDFETQKKFYPDIFIKEKTHSLISISQAASSKLTQKLSDKIFDMEAFAFAKSCKFYQPLHHIQIYKFISDKGNLELDPELVFKHYSESVIEIFLKIKEQFLRVFSKNQNNLNEEALTIIKSIGESLKLTTYQLHQLENAINYYLYFNTLNDLIKVIPMQHFKHKRDKNSYFKNLLAQLYAF